MVSNENNSTDGKSPHHHARHKGSTRTVRVGSRSLPLYPLVITCLGLLNIILLLTAVVLGIYCGKVSGESTPDHLIKQMSLTEMEELQKINSEAVKAKNEATQELEKELRNHQQFKLHLEQNKTLCDNLERQLEVLQVEKATILSTSSVIRESCGRCLPEWFLSNTSCYFHGKSSNTLKNWPDSRADCISRGGDLAVIDNWEEQANLFERLPNLPRSSKPLWMRPGGIWIGLTDIQTEGTWVWVNNVTLLDEGYWIQDEPNNHGAKGEDCVALMNTDNPRRTWFDGDCLTNREWLCEMAPS